MSQLYELQKGAQQRYRLKHPAVTVRFGAELLEDLKRRAEDKGVSLTAYIRDIVVNHHQRVTQAYKRGQKHGSDLSELDHAITKAKRKKVLRKRE